MLAIKYMNFMNKYKRLTDNKFINWTHARETISKHVC